MLIDRMKQDDKDLTVRSQPFGASTALSTLSDLSTIVSDGVTWSSSSNPRPPNKSPAPWRTHHPESQVTASESTTPEVDTSIVVVTIGRTTTTKSRPASSRTRSITESGDPGTVVIGSPQSSIVTNTLQSTGVASRPISTTYSSLPFPSLTATVLTSSTNTNSPVATPETFSRDRSTTESTSAKLTAEKTTTTFPNSATAESPSSVSPTVLASTPSSNIAQPGSTLSTRRTQQSLMSVSDQVYTGSDLSAISLYSQSSRLVSIAVSESQPASSSETYSKSTSEAPSSTMAPDPSSTILVTMTMTIPDTFNPIPISDESDSTDSTGTSSSLAGNSTISLTSSSWQVSTTAYSSTSTVDISTSSSSDQSSSDGGSTQSDSTTVTTSSNITSLPTATSRTSSSEITATSSVVPEFVPPLQNDGIAYDHKFLLPILLSLGIPILVATMFFLYRHNCPEHYAKTERYCPFRQTIKFVKNLGPILALRERRERNRAIMERQKRYMTRRSRSRLWSRVPSTIGPPRIARSVRDTEQDQDEWLRNDMLEHCGEKARRPPSAAWLSDPATVADCDNVLTSMRKSGTGSSRSAWDKFFETDRADRRGSHYSTTFPAPRVSTAGSRSSIPPMRPWSGIVPSVFSQFQNAEYKPGQLTGDGPENEIEATRTMREMVRAQREKVLRDEAVGGASGLGTTNHIDQGGSSGDFVGGAGI